MGDVNGESETGCAETDAMMAKLLAEAMANPHFHGLGDSFQAYLDERGIVPERLRPDAYSCVIGFSMREQKWYGWSHRAIYGFGIGDSVEPGHCAYQPTDPADFLRDMLNFWEDNENHERTWAEHTDHEGRLGVRVHWIYSDAVPNEKLRGTQGGTFAPYPDKFGRGTWTAQTLDDARQMAIDYYEGVA